MRETKFWAINIGTRKQKDSLGRFHDLPRYFPNRTGRPQRFKCEAEALEAIEAGRINGKPEFVREFSLSL
jgi:hypothetical protein